MQHKLLIVSHLQKNLKRGSFVFLDNLKECQHSYKFASAYYYEINIYKVKQRK